MYQPEIRILQVDRRAHEVRFPGETWPGVRRILVVRNDRLRDLLLTLPALHALRAAYPAAWIGLVVRRPFVSLASRFADVDEVLADPIEAAETQRLLSRYRADLLVCISREARIPWAAWKCGIPRRLGPGYRVWSPIFHRRVDEHRRPGDHHEVERALSFAHLAGAPGEEAVFRVDLDDGSRENAANWLDLHRIRRSFVVLHPGGGLACPAWPVGHFIQLATLLVAEGIPVVFSVGPGDPVTHALEEEHPRIRRLPRYSGDLVTLAAMLSGDCVLVGGNSGPGHLAAALGSPVIALHAPWSVCSPRRWGPYSDRGWAITPHLPEALDWSRRRRRNEGERLMSAIPPTVALRCVRSVLEGGSPESAEEESAGPSLSGNNSR